MDTTRALPSRYRKNLSAHFETVIAQLSHVEEQLATDHLTELDAVRCEKDSTIVDADCMQTYSHDNQEFVWLEGHTRSFREPLADRTQGKPLLPETCLGAAACLHEPLQTRNIKKSDRPAGDDGQQLSTALIKVADQPTADVHALLQQHQTWMLQTWMVQQESMITRVVSRALSNQTLAKGCVGSPCMDHAPSETSHAPSSSARGCVGPPYPLLEFADVEVQQSEARWSRGFRGSKCSSIQAYESVHTSSTIRPSIMASFSIWKAQHKMAHKMSTFDARDNLRRSCALTKAQLALDDNHVTEAAAPKQDKGHVIQAIVKHSYFEVFFSVVLVTNAVFVGIQVTRNSRSRDDASAPAVPMDLYVVSFLYAVLFAWELVMRMCAAGYPFFRLNGSCFWNYLDLFIVPCTIFELVLDTIVVVNGTTNKITVTGNIKAVRMLRSVRLFRVVRITRLLRFCHDLRVLVFSIMASSKALIWVFILLLGILYMFGVVFAQTVNDYYIESSTSGGEVVQWDKLYKFWGTLPRSMFTLFKSISGGLSWQDCVYPLYPLGPHWIVVFVCFVSITYFSILNVVTGIFCQGAIERTQEDQDLIAESQIANSEMFQRQLHEIFRKIDSDGSGVLSLVEFEENVHRPDVEAFFHSLDVDTSDAWALFKMLDADEGNEIDIDEFVLGLMKLKGRVKRCDILQLEVMLSRILAKQSRMMDSIMEMQGEIQDIPAWDGGRQPHRRTNVTYACKASL